MTRELRGSVWLLAVLVGCAVPRIGNAPVSTGNDAADARFSAAYQKWQREQQIYSAFDVKLFFAAIEESWEFRQVRVERLGVMRAATQTEIDQQLAQERAEDAQFEDFTFGVHANERQFDDFDRKDSIWRTALVTPKGEELPAKWDRVGRPDVNTKAIYSFLGDFWVLYHVRFNRVVPPETPVTLRMASSVGRVEFTFPGQ